MIRFRALKSWVIGGFIAGFILSGSGVASAAEAEKWKGEAPTAEFTLGGLAGLGIIDSTAGFVLLGTAAKKISNRGFAPDINNQVFIEAELGPYFAKGSTAFVYSTHLRWDFIYDPQWTFYALGGVGGNITPEELGDHFALFPRFGIGTLWQFSDAFDPVMKIRFELSHEVIAAGLSFSL